MTGTGRKTKPRPRHTFVLNYAKNAKFRSGGLRSFFAYRDLGIARATNGRFLAHVIRAAKPVMRGTGRHHHELDFQMVYVTRGWVRFIYEGQGTFVLKAGDCVLQPPGIRHELEACSKNLELIEITSPAEFATRNDPLSPANSTMRRR
jgi:mannose-6-phosphate isomerase-like protein (cupin superfamily)